VKYKDFLKNLHEQEWFQRFSQEELIPNIPSVPEWSPGVDNTEQWKYASGMRSGYLICLQMLGVNDGTGDT
jgi:hypothetical protein